MVVGSVREDCDGMCWQSIVNEYFNGPEDARSKIEFVISTELPRLRAGPGDNAIHKMAEVILNVRATSAARNDAGDDKSQGPRQGYSTRSTTRPL